MENYTLYNKIFGFVDFETIIADIAISAVILILFFVAAKIISKHSQFIASKLFRAKTETMEKVITSSFSRPICLFLQITGIFFAVRTLPFSATLWVTLWPIVLKAYRISSIFVVCLGLISLVGNVFVFSPKFSAPENKTIVNFVSKLAKSIIILFAVAAFLKELNFDVSGIVAGLGISGVVLALAAQDTASNFFSGIVILFDKPFAIGDWISVGGMEGIVEEMNFRSCRIRTFDNALISVPNSALSSDSVTNWQKMQFRKALITIGVTYSTSSDTIRKVCDEIRDNLKNNPDVDSDRVLVWFDNFGASSLDICIQYHSRHTALADHVTFKDKVNHMIMDVVAKHDTDFAFDTKTVIIENS